MKRTATCLSILFSVLSFLLAHRTYGQTVTTIASETTIGDGSTALNAAVGGPVSVTFDRQGSMYVSDAIDIRIRKIDGNGIASTVAGTGELGSPVANQQAIAAGFNGLRGISTNAAGELYLTDTQNYRIWKIDTQGIITVVAGTGEQGSSGDGGPAKDAKLLFPRDVTVDATGNIYIADTQNHRIRKVGTNGIITTVAGTGTEGFGGDGGLATNAQLRNPYAVAIGSDGSLYIADTYNNRIRKVDPNGIIMTIAGTGAYDSGGDGGAATSATLKWPQDIAIDANGTVYFSQQDARIRKITSSATVQAVAGNGTEGFSGDGGPATSALIGPAAGVDVDANGNLYVADQNNFRIRQITTDGTINTIAGGYSGDGGPATNAFFRKTISKSPADMVVDAQGNVYVSDRFGNRIRKVTPAGTVTSVAGTGIYGYAGDGGPATQATLRHPRGVGLDAAGNVYTVDQYNTRLRRIDGNGTISAVAGDGRPDFISSRPFFSSADIYNATGMAVSKNGTAYVPTQNCILKITSSGVISIVAGTTASTGYSGDGGPATSAQLSFPSSVALDNQENLYITDNNRVRKVDANGIITTVAGNGSTGYGGEGGQATATPLNYPYGVTFDIMGIMYITESGFSRIRQVDRNGVITTLPVNVQLSSPRGITTDAAGNFYVADEGNRRVRKITYPVKTVLTASNNTACSPSSVTLTAQPSGPGFAYQFGPSATQIGTTNQAVVSASGVYSVTLTTSIFGSPAGSASVSVQVSTSASVYTLKAES